MLMTKLRFNFEHILSRRQENWAVGLGLGHGFVPERKHVGVSARSSAGKVQENCEGVVIRAKE
jgi:hypothetical protein